MPLSWPALAKRGAVQVPQHSVGCFQSNANWSPKRAKPEISGRQLTPLSQGGGAVLFEDGAAGEVAIETEMVLDRGVNGGEFLQGPVVARVSEAWYMQVLRFPKRDQISF